MIECLILGDSIAVGVSTFEKQCTAQVATGYTSAHWNKKFPRQPSTEVTIISLGTNDQGMNTKAELRALRDRLTTRHVYWIVPPIKPQAQEAVKAISAEYKDELIFIKQLSKDGVHPTMAEYKRIGQEALK